MEEKHNNGTKVVAVILVSVTLVVTVVIATAAAFIEHLLCTRLPVPDMRSDPTRKHQWVS